MTQWHEMTRGSRQNTEGKNNIREARQRNENVSNVKDFNHRTKRGICCEGSTDDQDVLSQQKARTGPRSQKLGWDTHLRQEQWEPAVSPDSHPGTNLVLPSYSPPETLLDFFCPWMTWDLSSIFPLVPFPLADDSVLSPGSLKEYPSWPLG